MKRAFFAQIRPELLHTDREFEQLKEVLFAHVNAALRPEFVILTFGLDFQRMINLSFLAPHITRLTHSQF